ncbi:MAG: PCRF domain-containing protein, partial [Anaerolineales bacterium]|nr:PCRF domain-containing protein [Anaerolineales bacterium]
MCGGGFDVANKADKITQLEQLAAAPDFWDDSARAQEMMQDLTKLRDEVGDWQKVSQRLEDALLLAEMDDEALQAELSAELEMLDRAVSKLEFRALFAGKYDDEDAILAIHAGAGGTEAQEWAQILQR